MAGEVVFFARVAEGDDEVHGMIITFFGGTKKRTFDL